MNKNLKENIENAKIILFKEKDIKNKITWLVFANFIFAILCALFICGIYFIKGSNQDKLIRTLNLAIFLSILNLYLPVKILLLKKLLIYKDINEYKFIKYLMPYFIICFCFSYYKEIKTDYINSQLEKNKKLELKHIAKYFGYYKTINYEEILIYLKSNDLIINKYNILSYLLKKYENNKNYEPLNIFLCLNTINRKKLKKTIIECNFETEDINNLDKSWNYTKKIVNFESDGKKIGIQKITLTFNLIAIVVLPFYFLTMLVLLFSFMTSIGINAQNFAISRFGFRWNILTLIYFAFHLTWILPIAINTIVMILALISQKFTKREKVSYISTTTILIILNISIVILNEFTNILTIYNQYAVVISALILVFIIWIPFAFYLKSLIAINVNWYEKYFNLN